MMIGELRDVLSHTDTEEEAGNGKASMHAGAGGESRGETRVLIQLSGERCEKTRRSAARYNTCLDARLTSY